MKLFAVCVIVHEPIKIQTCSAPQNDRLNFVFLKDMWIAKKWLQIVVKLHFSCPKFWGPPSKYPPTHLFIDCFFLFDE